MSYEAWGDGDEFSGPELPEGWLNEDNAKELRDEVARLTALTGAEPFQGRVQPWMMECFGPMISGDREERNHRFLEESLELVQACGCSASEAHQLVDYVFGRPIGEKVQEVGGVMVTLAALCLANDVDMHAAGETELARIWTKVEQIRTKQAAKPKHSPLPQLATASGAEARLAAFDLCLLAVEEAITLRGARESIRVLITAASADANFSTWTGNSDADSALIMLDRMDVPADEDARIDAISATIRRLAADAQAPVAQFLVAPIGDARGEFHAKLGRMLINYIDRMNDITGGEREEASLLREYLAAVEPIFEEEHKSRIAAVVSLPAAQPEDPDRG